MFDVSIDLRRLDAGVTQHFLNLSQIGAAGQQVSCETVAKAVGTDLGINSGAAGIVFDQSPKVNAVHGLAASRQKQFFGWMQRFGSQHSA